MVEYRTKSGWEKKIEKKKKNSSGTGYTGNNSNIIWKKSLYKYLKST